MSEQGRQETSSTEAEIIAASLGERGDPEIVEANRHLAGTRSLDERTPVVAVTLAGVASFLNLYATQPLLPLLADTFHASKSAIGMTVSASTLGVALSAPFCGALAERIGRKRVITVATFALAVPTLLAATAGSLQALIVWRFLQGIVMPGIFGVTIAYIAEEWSARSVAPVMSIYVSGTVLGGFLGRVLTGAAATHQFVPGVRPSWRLGFILIGILDLLFGLIIWRWLPPDRAHASHEPLASSESIRRHLRNPSLLATYFVGFNVLFSLVATFTYITFHLAAPPYRLNPSQLSWLFVVYLVGLVVTPVAGWWITRVGSRTALMMAVLMAMVGVSITLLPSLRWILFGLVLCSSGVFICQSASTVFIQRVAPAGGRASAAGLYVAFYYIGGTVAGVVPGYLWRFGGWTACVLLVVAVQALTIGAASVFFKSQPAA